MKNCDSKGRRLVQFYAGGRVGKKARRAKLAKKAKGGKVMSPMSDMMPPSASPDPMEGRLTTGVVGRPKAARRGMPTFGRPFGVARPAR